MISIQRKKGQSEGSMKGGRGGGSTPSYKEVVASRGKRPLENDMEIQGKVKEARKREQKNP